MLAAGICQKLYSKDCLLRNALCGMGIRKCVSHGTESKVAERISGVEASAIWYGEDLLEITGLHVAHFNVPATGSHDVRIRVKETRRIRLPKHDPVLPCSSSAIIDVKGKIIIAQQKVGRVYTEYTNRDTGFLFHRKS